MRARWIVAGAGALVFGVALALLRGAPVAASDQGVYLSIAARILDGDHLYADVVEPKDPLFFYTYAAALWVGDWRGPFLLDGVWLALAGLAFALLLRELRAPTSAVVTGFFVYPFALTAAWFQPGLSMLAALALSPLVAWLWLRGWFVASGALLGVVMLFKLNLAVVAGAPLLAFLLLGTRGVSWRAQIGRAAAGLSGTLLAAAAILAVRGELRPYLDMIAYNVHYANSLVSADGPLGRQREHLEIVVDFFELSGRWQLPAALLVLAGFAVAAALIAVKGSRQQRLLAGAGATVLVATLFTLAMTAYWSHHLQMLAFPAALIAATFVSVASREVGQRAGIAVAAVCVLFALWSSVKHESSIDLAPQWREAPHSGGAVALERARQRFHPTSNRVSYIVFGGNSENGHAAFIGEEFELVCRWFHLYPESLDEQFDETLRCSRREDPMLVLITLGFFDERPAPPEWGEFVAGARRLLETRYELVETEHPGFQVWKRVAQA
jgi:4-amino-4-deoxy-L-arabinose transferase-like glycosyltransferase